MISAPFSLLDLQGKGTAADKQFSSDKMACKQKA
jgi:hypothetical protein